MEPMTPPSALDELANDPSSRKRFLRMAGGGAVAAALSAAIAACGDDRQLADVYGGAGVGTKRFGQGDAGIAAYVLFLERLETAFYDGAVKSGRLSGRALELAQRFGAEEREHVTMLEAELERLGGKEPRTPGFNFVFENQAGIVRTAAQLETVGAGAYLGQVGRVREQRFLATVLSLHSVEARHASALALLRGESITPDGPFANPAPSADVDRQVQPFLSA